MKLYSARIPSQPTRRLPRTVREVEFCRKRKGEGRGKCHNGAQEDGFEVLREQSEGTRAEEQRFAQTSAGESAMIPKSDREEVYKESPPHRVCSVARRKDVSHVVAVLERDGENLSAHKS